LIEPLGYDSIWTVEHHFTPYTMVNDPLQFLTYWAGRAERTGVGTMVTVLPWHNPVRVAEQMVMLQHVMGDDRDVMIGFGRGASRREYGGLNVDMRNSRELFDEGVPIVKGLLENERFAFEGQHYTVPDASQRPESPDLSLRPRPRNSKALLDNLYVAWGSPQIVQFTGSSGLKPLIIPQRGLQAYITEDAPIGTPDKVLSAIQRVCDWVHGDQITAVFKMGGMPLDIAERSLRLFAKEVLPAIHEMKPLGPLVPDEVVSG
jgi:alkanesulfonate monooxygenase SsuD/methylene tetrahydromethanopterin reductase-like flavin-dependent oxidoreductase (luciferase family)